MFLCVRRQNPKHCKDRRWLQSVGAFPSLFNFTLCAFAILMLFLTLVGIEIVSYRNRTAFFLLFFFSPPCPIFKTFYNPQNIQIPFSVSVYQRRQRRNPSKTQRQTARNPKILSLKILHIANHSFHFFLVAFFFSFEFVFFFCREAVFLVSHSSGRWGSRSIRAQR